MAKKKQAASPAPTPWRNRIVEHGEAPPEQLLPNPQNWRTHPQFQQQVLSGVLNDVGIVQSVIVNKRTGRLVDGHLRVMLAMREKQPSIPVVYVDLSEKEEAEVLATLDPISALAESDDEQLRALIGQIESGDPAVIELLEALAKNEPPAPDPSTAEQYKPTFAIIIEVGSDREQRDLLERFAKEGLKCKALIA